MMTTEGITEPMVLHMGEVSWQGRFANGRVQRLVLLTAPIGNVPPLRVESTSAARPRHAEPMMKGTEQINRAEFVAPSTIKLEFADHRRFCLPIEKLGVPIDQFDWPTLKKSPGGEQVVVR